MNGSEGCVFNGQGCNEFPVSNGSNGVGYIGYDGR